MVASLWSPEVELARVRDVLAYRVMDTPPEPCFDRLAAMAAEACDTPVALISLLDDDRQWFKARIGIDAIETPKSIAFCSYAIREPSQMMVVPDLSKDDRFRDNPLVVGGPRARFYAGVPLVVATGRALGTLCVVDVVPRELTARQRASLRAMATVVVRYLERRRAAPFN